MYNYFIYLFTLLLIFSTYLEYKFHEGKNKILCSLLNSSA